MSEAHSIFTLTDEQFGWYLSGLVDGEGFFTVTPFSPRQGCHSWRMRFGIKLRADDSAGLRAAAERLGIGSLQARHSDKFSPQLQWIVTKQSELAEVVVPQFERYPLQLKKARDFEIWKQCILVLYRKNKRPWPAGQVGGKPSLRPDEYAFIEAASARLREGRKFDSGLTIDHAKAIKPAPAKTLFDDL